MGNNYRLKISNYFDSGTFNSLKTRVFGDTDKISSERYFVTVTSLAASVFLMLLCLVHLMMGFSFTPVYLAGSSSLVMVGLYYFVRFRTCLLIPKVVLTGLGLIMLDLSWYSKFLSSGPVLFFILIFASLVIWVWDGKYLAILLAYYFANLAVLFYIDYNAPGHLFEYPSPQSRSIDIFLSFFFYSVLLISLLYVVKKEFLRQKTKAEMSDKLKTAFLSNMSHEIRTPMNGILGFTGLLKEPDLSAQQQHEYIEIIEKSGQRLLSIINDIIDISKIESGFVKVKTELTDLEELTEYLYSFFTPEAESKGLQLIISNKLSGHCKQTMTDTEKLYAIFTNLVKNAIKFTANGTIEVSCEIINIKNKPFFQFFVKDTGIGIAKNKQIEIFKRFIQVDILNKMAYHGSGLGLAISKAYVEMLGGNIWVESEEGQGSVFYFTIPHIADRDLIANNKNAAVPSENVHVPLKLKILVADDDEKSAMLATILVKKFANEVLLAKSGTEAVEICQKTHDIDLVLMDLQMPEMDGFEATKLIKQFNNHVTIIAQTAFAFSSDKEKVLSSGFDDYIAKPIDSKDFLKLIKKHFYP
jgi:signal transduction histidine kinase